MLGMQKVTSKGIIFKLSQHSQHLCTGFCCNSISSCVPVSICLPFPSCLWLVPQLSVPIKARMGLKPQLNNYSVGISGGIYVSVPYMFSLKDWLGTRIKLSHP